MPVQPKATRSPLRGLVALPALDVPGFAPTFMIASIRARWAETFGTAPGGLSLVVPAYLIPYGATPQVWGPLLDRLGRRPVILGSLLAFAMLTVTTTLADIPEAFLGVRPA